MSRTAARPAPRADRDGAVAGDWRDGKPTVALSVPHGFTARMFLRSPLLGQLTARVGHVGVFAPPAALERLREQFAGPALSFYPLRDDERRRDRLAAYGRLLFFDWRLTDTLRMRERDRWMTSTWRRALWPLRERLGTSAGLNRSWYALENRAFPDRYHAAAFRALRPDLLVTPTPGVLLGDIRLIRRARASGVPSMAFIQGWDNLTSKAIVGARPDRLAVWNGLMREEAIRLHGFAPERVVVTGAPHFDPYFTREGWVSRERFLATLGLDPGKRIVLYAASTPRYFPEHGQIVDLLVEANRNGAFGDDVQIVVRLHPQTIEGVDAEDIGKYDRHAGQIYLDVPRGRTGLPADYDPDGIRHAGQLIEASAVTVSVASSFTLDTAIFDRPIVNVRFDGSATKPYERSVRRHYDSDHYRYVVRTGAVRLADSPAMLIDEVRRYLADPTLERAERARLVRDICWKTDGRSSVRVAQAIADAAAASRRHAGQG